MRKMQGAENEGEGSVLTYVTEPEFLKQHSSLRVMTQHLLSKPILSHQVTAKSPSGWAIERYPIPFTCALNTPLRATSSLHVVPTFNS